MSGDEIRDLTDDEARRALPLKWGAVPVGTVPAWVAEMDVALAPAIADAVSDAVRAGTAGYPPFGDAGVGAALAGFAGRHWDQDLPPDATVVVGDVDRGHPDRAGRAVPAGPGGGAAPLLPAVPRRGAAGRPRADRGHHRPGRRRRRARPGGRRGGVPGRRAHLPALQPAQPARPGASACRARGAARPRGRLRRPGGGGRDPRCADAPGRRVHAVPHRRPERGAADQRVQGVQHRRACTAPSW